MYDSTNVARLPIDGDMYAAYMKGALIPSTVDAVKARFPSAIIVTIAVTSKQIAMVGDVEHGDITPERVPDFLNLNREAGGDPSIYCSTYGDSGIEVVESWCKRRGVQFDRAHWWRAHYNNIPRLEMGESAHQYQNAAQSGGPWDVSVVADHWPGVPDLAVKPIPSKPVPVQVPAFPGVMRRGSKGVGVKAWQARMKQRGWVIVDGDFGPGTERVCRLFQQQVRLTDDGIVGPQTWAASWRAPIV
jgi:peptidoglycan hydrolase-like protein with peptidoglycan-binding domain